MSRFSIDTDVLDEGINKLSGIQKKLDSLQQRFLMISHEIDWEVKGKHALEGNLAQLQAQMKSMSISVAIASQSMAQIRDEYINAYNDAKSLADGLPTKVSAGSYSRAEEMLQDPNIPEFVKARIRESIGATKGIKGTGADIPGLIDTYTTVPSAYESYINNLKAKHPNWKFYFFDVATPVGGNTTFNSFAQKQFSDDNDLDGYNTSSDPNYWWYDSNGNPSEVKDTSSSGDTYRRVSEAAIRQLGDPRYYMNESLIWAFKMDGFDPNLQTQEGVEDIFADYSDGRINLLKQYSEIFYEAARTANVDAYTLASKANNETGGGYQDLAQGYLIPANTQYTVTTIEGKTETRYTPNIDTKVYNFGSIGCSDGAGSHLRGALYALDPNKDGKYDDAWTSIDKAIEGMANFVKDGYISRGQDTLYSMKFNVSDGDYKHQYQTNILAPSTRECSSIRNTLSNVSDKDIIFKIPVFSDFV